MENSKFVSLLSRDARLNPVSGRLTPGAYVGFWAAGALAIVGLSIVLLPVREDLLTRFHDFDYFLLFFAWLLAAILPAIRVYASAFPEAKISGFAEKLGRFAWVPFAALLAWTLLSVRFEEFGYQVRRETNILNGGCGAVVLVAGSLHASFLFAWLRRGASTNAARSGAWAALSTGAFVSFVIQFACANENPLHVLFWHLIPLSILTFGASFAARRFLRW